MTRRRWRWLGAVGAAALACVLLAVVLLGWGMAPARAAQAGFWKFPVSQVFPTVAAADTDGIHAAITVPTGSTSSTVVTASITQPDIPRTLTVTGSASGADGSTVTVQGLNQYGLLLRDPITPSGTDTVEGKVAFAVVDSITITGVASPGGATVTVGTGQHLGLWLPIASPADVVNIDTVATAGTAWVRTAAGALPTGADVDAKNGTVCPETTITAADGYRVDYLAIMPRR